MRALNSRLDPPLLTALLPCPLAADLHTVTGASYYIRVAYAKTLLAFEVSETARARGLRDPVPSAHAAAAVAAVPPRKPKKKRTAAAAAAAATARKKGRAAPGSDSEEEAVSSEGGGDGEGEEEAEERETSLGLG